MAIDELLDEHEQGERVRTWLQRNAIGLIGGVVLGLALIGGWRWWQAHQETQRVKVGEQYLAAVDSIEARNLKQAQARVAALDGTYRSLAALDLAKAQVDAGQRDAAITTLRKAAGAEAGMDLIVQQRLARLLVDAGKAGEAASLLAGADDAAGLEVRGDAELALGRRDQARATYAKALARLDVAAPQRRLLELKFSEVGGKPTAPGSRI